jgi:dimethylargininase
MFVRNNILVSTIGSLVGFAMSEQQRLSRAIVRLPGSSFTAGLTTVNLGLSNYRIAAKQHAAYCEALETCGLTLTRLEPEERFPDSTFVEDTAVMVNLKQKPAHEKRLGRFDELQPSVNKSNQALHGRASACSAILTRPGVPSRAGEVESIAEALAGFCAELHAIEAPGTLDGGDVCEAVDHFFIGISERTNEAGARQLARHLASYNYTSSFVDIRSVKNILHLKSGLAWLGDDRLAVIDELAAHPAFRAYELVRVNASEQYATNCVRVNDQVLLATGYPEFERTLGKLGYQTITLEMSEFQKMDGGLSCLSLRF